MKQLSLITLLCLIFSCSEDASIPSGVEDEPSLFGYTFKTFNLNQEVLDSTYYELDNNRIISFSGLNLVSQQTSSATFTYESDKISQISRFTDGALQSRRTFQYSGDDLTELLIEINNCYHKISFDYTAADTIKVEHRGSNDGIDFDIQFADSKIVLDANDNRIYFEDFDYANQESSAVQMDFDVNNNPISETFLTDFGNGLNPTFTNTLTFESSRNTLYEINENTYGKRTLMLLYHLQTNAVNQINARTIAPNNIGSFSSTFGSQFSTVIINQIGLGDYAELNNFKTFINATLINEFELEFLIR